MDTKVTGGIHSRHVRYSIQFVFQGVPIPLQEGMTGWLQDLDLKTKQDETSEKVKKNTILCWKMAGQHWNILPEY